MILKSMYEYKNYREIFQYLKSNYFLTEHYFCKEWIAEDSYRKKERSVTFVRKALLAQKFCY